jgi:SAM-dependent methyltransferase
MKQRFIGMLIWLANGVLNLLAKLAGRGRSTTIEELWYTFTNMQILRMNVKNFGYQMARDMLPGLARIETTGEPRVRALVSKPTTQADVESPWFVYWCNELHAAPIYHRKLWEFAFSLQALFDAGLLREGAKGIGFGCGEEPLASYFAAKGMDVMVTDLAPEKVAGLGWAESGQHAKTIERAFHKHIASREAFDRHVRHAFVDMNSIPEFDEKFDFCWSICALEHLGSISKGLAFIENSLRCLKPGGIAVHTTEYNCLPDRGTIDHWPTVLFQRRHFEALALQLARSGHRMLGPDFDIGSGPIDRYIDMPPYFIDECWLSQSSWGASNQSAHLKLSIDGFPCTCYGLVIRKAGA